MTLHQPRVTVYTVNHNYGRYIEQAIASVLEQTEQNFELIIIDDGSTDGSVQLLERYESNPMITVIFQQNRGLNISNNIALRAARGRYFVRLDADDWFDRNALKVMADLLDGSPETALIFPDYCRVDENGQLIDVVRRHDFEKVSLMDLPAHGACTMFRREALELIGGYDEEFSCQDGYELWIRLIAAQHRVANVNLPLFYYRQHCGSLTNNEERILSTRGRILEKAADMNGQNLRTLAVIPVRGGNKLGEKALDCLAGRPLIDWTILAALASKRLEAVIVSTPDPDIIRHVETTFPGSVMCLRREHALARPNTHVDDTLVDAVNNYAKTHAMPDAVALMMIESPFRSSNHIDAAIDVMRVFSTDLVVAVRPDHDNFYRHDGYGLSPLRKGALLTLETEDLFRECGQLRILNVGHLLRPEREKPPRIGHVTLDQMAAFVINSEWDWNLAGLIAERAILKETSA